MNTLKECSWCNSGAPPIPMECGTEMPFVCSACGTGLGALDHEGLSIMINTLRKDLNKCKKALKLLSK